jgi:hypothetical protein
MTERSGGEHDVAVVGGLVGSAIAWGLARVGMPEYAGWTKRSSEGWAGFAAALEETTGIDVAFQRPGGFQLALSEAELEVR